MTDEQLAALRSLETAVRIRRPEGRTQLVEMAARAVVKVFRGKLDQIVVTFPAGTGSGIEHKLGPGQIPLVTDDDQPSHFTEPPPDLLADS